MAATQYTLNLFWCLPFYVFFSFLETTNETEQKRNDFESGYDTEIVNANGTRHKLINDSYSKAYLCVLLLSVRWIVELFLFSKCKAKSRTSCEGENKTKSKKTKRKRERERKTTKWSYLLLWEIFLKHRGAWNTFSQTSWPYNSTVNCRKIPKKVVKMRRFVYKNEWISTVFSAGLCSNRCASIHLLSYLNKIRWI